MILAIGKIASALPTDRFPLEVPLFTADRNTRITYMQFVSEHTSDVALNLYLILNTGQVRILPLNTILSANTTIIQFDNVNYELQNIEQIVAVSSVNNVINYVISGEFI